MMTKNFVNTTKNTKMALTMNRLLLSAAACSALYLGYLQPLHAQQIGFAKPVLSEALRISNYTQTPSAWNKVFIDINAQPANFANYRAPKIQLSTAKSSLGLRLGYRLSPNISLSTYYGNNTASSPIDALIPLNPSNAFSPKFNANGFTSTHAGIDLTGQMSLLKHLTLFGNAGIATYSHSGNYPYSTNANTDGSAKSARFARFGLGLHYDVNTRLGLRLEMERLRPLGPIKSAFGVESGLDNYSLGAVFKF